MTVAPQQVCAPGGRRSGWARWWPGIRLLGGVLVLAVVLRQLGTGPFLVGIRSLDVPAVLAAVLIGVVTTVCSAWRWRVVAGRLGLVLGWGPAVAAYYGSQFLNATLPGGVLGDVHRALRHGRTVDDVGRGARAVLGERAAGPVTHVALTVLVLLALPGPPMTWLLAPLAVVVVVLAGAAGLVLLRRRGAESTRWSRLAGPAVADLRSGVLARSAWPQILSASMVVAIGHAITFVIAARLVGVPASPLELAPATMVVLAAMLVPVNVGGWGPRESVAAAVFGAAGWGAAAGVAAATAFGVLALIATLPGLVVLVARPLARSQTRPSRAWTRAARDG
ncbi:MAG TPA: lysylphosphatidylglycerol synthase transmembrane domain-containing protein [Nakamurella sp.]|jgi:uncharacterized membrane protein YbhN (UPF0104 family)